MGILQICCVENTADESVNSNSKNVPLILDERLEKNRKLWSENKINNYDFKLEVHEIGFNGLLTSAEIKVRDGKATDFRFSGNNQNAENLQKNLRLTTRSKNFLIWLRKNTRKNRNILLQENL